MSEPEGALTEPYVLRYAYKRSLGPVRSRFFTALRAGRVLGARCPSGRVVVPPAEYDPQTGEEIEELVPVGAAGVVTTWTWIAEPAPTDRPFAWALVRLDGADTALLHALDVPSEDALHTGMRVGIRWAAERAGTMHDIACFVPEAIADGPLDESEGEPVTRFKVPVRLDYTVTAGQEQSRFLRAVEHGRIMGVRCPSTGRVHVPPRGAISDTGERADEWVQVADHGTVTTFCVVNIPFEGQVLEPPYVAGSILLDRSDVPVFHLVGGIAANQVTMGMRVRAVWEDEPGPSFASVRYFEPTGEPDVPFDVIREHL